MNNEDVKLVLRTFVGMLIGSALGAVVAHLLGWLP